MPKIMNTSWLAVIIATLVFFGVGAAWYSVLFEAQWLEASGMTKEQADTAMAETGMGKWLFFALLITLAQAIGILMVINHAGAKRLKACLRVTFWLVVTVVAPLVAYACVYNGYSLTGYLVDIGYLFVGYMVCAVIYSMFRGKDAVDA